MNGSPWLPGRVDHCRPTSGKSGDDEAVVPARYQDPKTGGDRYAEGVASGVPAVGVAWPATYWSQSATYR